MFAKMHRRSDWLNGRKVWLLDVLSGYNESGFTLMIRAMILLLGQQMSVSAVARCLGEGSAA